MTRWTLFVMMGLSLSLVACGGGAGDDDQTAPEADAGSTPDSAPVARTYPEAPYGTVEGATISDRKWQGWMDTDVDTDNDPFNEPAHEISLGDFYSANNPDSHLLVLIQSAGWCAPCQEEAAQLPAVAAQWVPRGIRFMTAMLQNPDGSPGTTSFSQEWGLTFHQDTPIVADPTDQAGSEFGATGIPFFILIDTKDMKIIGFPQERLQDMGPFFEQYATH